MPTTDGYNGAYTGPEIDAGIARANQAITVENSGEVSMSETLGSGPYTIEFTEEAGSGGGSLPDGSAGQILGYVEDNVVGPIMSKRDLLSDETAEMYRLSGEEAVPNDVLNQIYVMIQMMQVKKAYVSVSVQLSDGTPVGGVQLSNTIKTLDGDIVYTDSAGKASGYVDEGTIVLSIYNCIDVAGNVTMHDIVAGNFYNATIVAIQQEETDITSTGIWRFSSALPFTKMDVTGVGGGGGASFAGGGGGHVSTALSIDIAPTDFLRITIGAGGNVANQAGQGGNTQVLKNGVEILKALGGGGASQGSHGLGNGKGGDGYNGSTPGTNGTAGSGFKFDDPSKGLAGGGGGGGSNASFNSPTSGGSPFGASGAYRPSHPATIPTGPGGGGGGGNLGDSSYSPSAGASGRVYIRLKTEDA